MTRKITQQIADRVLVKMAQAPQPPRPLTEGVGTGAAFMGGSGALLGKLIGAGNRPWLGVLGGGIGGAAIGAGTTALQNYLKNREAEQQLAKP